MKKLIINADDYGHTPGVGEGIRQAHLHGIVTSTTAMMNRPAAAMELPTALQLCPNLGIGLHLVLTTGRPVLPAEVIPTLVKPDGGFYPQAEFVERLPIINLAQVAAEWHAQLEKFVSVTGRAPDHLDSHHHSSYFNPALFERMLRLAEDLHCPIRKPFGDGSADAADYLPPQLAEEAGQGFMPLTARARQRTTDGFIGDFYDEGATLEHLIRIIDRIVKDTDRETFELMCHPAVVDGALMAVSSYNLPRRQELEILMDSQIKGLILNHGIKLINYSELHGSAYS